MFKSVPTRGLADQRSVPTVASRSPEQDDDNISLTSTVCEEHDPNEEFTVQDIHMESVPEDSSDEKQYLVEWENYPLHQCTWEPESHLGDLEYWKEKKERQRRGEEEAWTWEKWDAIQRDARKKKRKRHRLRNARRRKLGLPETEPFDDSSSESNASSDEAPLAEVSAARRRSQDPQKGANVESEKHQKKKSQDENQPRPSSARRASKDPVPPPRPERQSSTGYQGTARKPPTGEPGTASRRRGILSNSARPPKLQLTAKRTAPAPGNVFAGGKKRKPRTGLKEKLSDPTQERKFFPNHRVRRLAEKHTRDKADGPPPLQPNLFLDLKAPRRRSSGAEPTSATSENKMSPLTTNPADTRIGLNSMVSEPDSVTSEAQNSISPAVTDAAAAPISAWDAAMHPREPISSVSPWDAALQKQPKKKKSVRFHENTESMFVDESVPMDIDSDPPQPGDGPAPEPRAPMPKPSIPTRIVETKLQFGFVQDSEPIVAIMDGVPTTSDDPWLTEFLKTEILRLEYTCSADDFRIQRAPLWQHFFCSGNVASGLNSPVLETVASYLREGELALFQTTPTYSVIVYPTSSDDWRLLLAELGVLSSKEDGSSSLKYCMFGSPDYWAPWMRRPTAAKIPEKRFNAFDEKLMWHLFKFDYQTLLPPVPREIKQPRHHFFLLFPRTRHSWLQAVTRWIQKCSPNCRIYSSYDSGSWSAFCDATKSRPGPSSGATASSTPVAHSSGPGAVIVHELLLPSLRRLTDLCNQLHHGRENYWCLSEGMSPGPMLSSMTLRDDVVLPGELQLIPLFPGLPKRCIAILLTPSFLSSEPRQVLELLQWFYNNFAVRRSPRCRLVTAYNLPAYLTELAEQKARARQRLLDEYRGDVLQAELAAKVAGLRKEDCESRFKACVYALELHQMREEEDQITEEHRYLRYADPSIDPNDEQSLLNWFGRWSMWRLDQFRGFFVVGSSSSMKAKGARRGVREIRIPKYTRVTINDPDIVREEVLRLEAEKQAQQNERILEVQQSNNNSLAPAPPAGPPPPRLGVFQSRNVVAENSGAFGALLHPIAQAAKPQIVLNKFPVSWMEPGQAIHFGDISEKFSTLERWWNFAFRFSKLHPCNTNVGYFYTPVEDWNPAAPPSRASRHPWICVYRSVMGHRYPRVEACEIIIWDPAARYRFPNNTSPQQPVREQDLAYGQRKAIDFLRKNTGVKNYGSHIEYIWYGGFDSPPNCDSPYPIDMALAMVDLMVTDPFKFLGLEPKHLERQGYREVKFGSEPQPSAATTSSGSMDIDRPAGRSAATSQHSSHSDDESDDDTRILFHPPPGKEKLPEGKRTRCFNLLYEEARHARREGREGDTEMRYDFPVTVEWYDVQRQEGRGFEHIQVAPWERVFQLLQIPMASDGGGGASARGSHAGLGTPSHSEKSFGGMSR